MEVFALINNCIAHCGSSGSKVPILPDSTTVHYSPYTTVCCIVVATYSLHVEVHPVVQMKLGEAER